MPTVQDLAARIVDWQTVRRQSGVPWRDRDVLGDLVQAVDEGEEWVEGDDNYTWWFVVGLFTTPRRIVEIGSRFGYSLKALTMLSPLRELLVVDDERDADKEPLRVLEHHFREVERLTVRREDSQRLTTLGETPRFDLGSVDACHTADGCHHDCGLVWDAIRPEGLMVVDDTQPGCVREGCERFCRERGVDFAYLPSLRGIHLVLKPEE